MRKSLAILPVLALIAGCSSDADTARYLIEPAAAPQAKVRTAVASVELREVSLPLYAEGAEVAYQAADGTVRNSGDHLWADEPARTVTMTLADSIADLTGAVVAAEPWPFPEDPDVRVEVRVAEMLARSDGSFRLAGQFFVAPLAAGRQAAQRFDIAVPLEAAGYQGIAAANAEALRRLAEAVAGRL